MRCNHQTPMRKLLILLSLFTFLITTGLKAQYNNYNLNSYTNPDFKKKSLDLGLNSIGKFYKNNTTNNNNLNGVFTFAYNNNKNSNKIQETLVLGVTGSINHNTFDSIDNQKSRVYSTGLHFDQKAHYYIDNKRFYEISPRVETSYKYSKNKLASTDYYKQKSNNFRSEFEVDLGIGKGRIENVTYARQAVYILDALSNKGFLKKHLNTNQINTFASQISIIKNKRYFDARERTIDELNYINNYLISMNYIDTVNTADYFLSLNDLWQNGDQQLRWAGHRFKFGVAPTFIFQQNDTTWQEDHHPEIKLTDTKWGGTVYIDYTNEKPLSLKVQRSFNAGMRNGLYRWRSLACNQLLTHIYGVFGMGYYLDTRTYVEGRINQDFYWNFTPKTSRSSEKDELTSNTTLTIKGYYFISSQVKLFGQYSLSYNFYRITQENHNVHDSYPGSSFQIGLAYSIF